MLGLLLKMPGPLDYYNLALEKAPVSYNQPQVFKAYVNYQLPLGRGRALLARAPKADGCR